MSKSKTQDRTKIGSAQALLDADIALRAAAGAFGSSSEEDDTLLEELRAAARHFADAWRACEGS